jgi:hypothetical protein
MPNIRVNWGEGRESTLSVDAALPAAEARAWLDEQYLTLGCEPLRASGKVLVADKLISIVDAAGEALFADAAWAERFAAAATGSTGRERVDIDLPTRALRY